ncbi:MAG: PASTA domain-containing protein [Clostridiales bacterium]|nr:PASTA domain-containing protein [Clostridiales bacterium]
MNTDNLCMNCFNPLTQGSICAKCGYDNDTVTDMLFLPPKTVLNGGRYIVGAFISQESDSASYSGYDTERKACVIIREFLPKNIANRLEGNSEVHIREKYKKSFEKYKDSFIKLWKTLKSLNSLSAVIPVVDVIEENGTAYAVCEKISAVTLRDFLLRSEDNNILWDKARLMFMPVLTTLENLHSNGIIHGGINPDNLVLCKDGKVRLAGFCINECNTADGELEFNENPGYTALEQYNNNHKICPATDIYAFSACIYRALVGTNPPDAVSREANDKLMIPNRIAEKIPAHVIKALGAGLQIYPEKRIQDVYDFRELLSAAPSVVAKSAISSVSANEEKTKQADTADNSAVKKKNKKNGRKKAAIALIAVAVILIAGLSVYIFAFTDILKKGEQTTQNTTLAKVTVPDFCTAKFTETDIKNNGPWNTWFKISFIYEYSTDVEAGIVFKQSVDAGESVDEGSDIVLTVSRGIETVAVPDVGGMSRDAAVKALEDKGFAVKIVTVYNDGSHTADYVKQNGGIAPEANSEIAKGEEVIIQVYGETETTTAAQTETQTAQ